MGKEKINIFYSIEAQFWRRKIGNKLENWLNGVDHSDALVRIEKEFRHSSPIESRKAAFSYFQSIIDVLYDGLKNEYKDDYQARIDIQYYLDSNNEVELGNTSKFKITDDFLNGIEIFMIVDKPLKGIKPKRNNKYYIHGIRYIDYQDKFDENLIDTLENLFAEYAYYEKYNYPTGKEIVLKHFDPIGGGAAFYLQTPFDWDIYMKECGEKK